MAVSTVPGGAPGRSAEPIQNWWAHDNPQGFGQPAQPAAPAPYMGVNRPTIKQNTMYGTQPVSGNAPQPVTSQPVSPNPGINSNSGGFGGEAADIGYRPMYTQAPPGMVRNPSYNSMYSGSQEFIPAQMQSATPHIGNGITQEYMTLRNPTGYQPQGSGQFSPLQMRPNPYTQQSNYYGQMAFNPYMYGGGQGMNMGRQMQGMNPYASMQQLQQWRNPYVNNMLAGGYLQQPQQFQMYNRPQLPQMPTMPQLPTFQQWNPYASMGAGPMPSNGAING